MSVTSNFEMAIRALSGNVANFIEGNFNVKILFLACISHSINSSSGKLFLVSKMGWNMTEKESQVPSLVSSIVHVCLLAC